MFLKECILDTDNKLYTSNDWDAANNSKAVGVAVITNEAKFVIAPDDLGSKKLYSNYTTPVSGISSFGDEINAKTDYNGLSNTDKIIEVYGSTDEYAAGACKNYTFKNKNKGYLPSLGEWWAAYQNKSEINTCMSKIGGTAISNNYYWNSSNSLNTSSDVSFWSLNWNQGTVGDNYANYSYQVRPFTSFSL